MGSWRGGTLTLKKSSLLNHARGAYEISDGSNTVLVSGPHLKSYNDPPTCDSGSIDSAHSPPKDSAHLESPLEDSAHTTSAHLELRTPLTWSLLMRTPITWNLLIWTLLNYTPHHNEDSPKVDFAQLDITCLDSHHDIWTLLNYTPIQDCLSPIAHNGTSG